MEGLRIYHPSPVEACYSCLEAIGISGRRIPTPPISDESRFTPDRKERLKWAVERDYLDEKGEVQAGEGE